MRRADRTVAVADLFCGAGGTSTGLIAAARALGYGDVRLIAINHWEVAVATHTRNHPEATHLCQSLESVNPREVVPGGRLDLLLASPECTHHSNARGGKPMSDQSRASAWCVLRWLEALHVEHVIIENVREFEDWGPLHPPDHPDEKFRNRPIPERKGRYFQNFVRNLRCLGYTVDWRVLNAADFGDATTRLRLFVQARKGRKRISWPAPSHVAPGEDPLGILQAQRWRPARDVIDWSLKGESIFTRKKPLAPNTLRRIFAGLQKFSGLPFILPHQHGTSGAGNVRSLEQPLPTITGTSADMFLAKPCLVVLRNHADGRSLEDPVPTLCGGNHVGLAEPWITTLNHGEGDHRAYSVDDPLKTITSVDAWGLVQSYIIGAGGPEGASRPRSVEDPLKAVLTENHAALCEPYVVGVAHAGANGSYVYDTERPLPTLTTQPEHGIAEPCIVPFHRERDGQAPRVHSVDAPLPTAACSSVFGLSQPYLIKFNGTGGAQSVDQPLDTITARDRFALVHPEVYDPGLGQVVGVLDIRFRMLQPHELARAMSFPDEYQFCGSREQRVKQIGNAVPVRTAEALCATALGGLA